MNVFLFGATGKTGYEILKRLLSERHKIKVLLRKPEKLNLKELEEAQIAQIKLIKGEASELEKLIENFKNSDIIISALGTGKKNNYTEVYSNGGRNILSAMRSNGVKKLITITSGLIDMSDPSTDNFFMNRIIRPNYNKVYYDQTRWETILDNTTDINWVCIRPTNLKNKPYTGNYRVNLNHCPKGGWKIGRADLADFIVKQVNSDEFIHQKPVIAY